VNSELEFQLHATIKGRVQGVGFRVYVQQYAATLHLTGWVRNTSIGDVEVLAEGSRPNLEKLLMLLESGPRGSHILQVDREWAPSAGSFSQFNIARTV